MPKYAIARRSPVSSLPSGNCAPCEGGEGALNEKEEIHANRKELEVHFVVLLG